MAGVRSGAEAWAPWGVGLLAMLVSTLGLGGPGLWYDEVVTLTMAQRSWSSMFSMLTSIDAVHGVYYSIMHLWLDLVPYSPVTLRLPSAVSVSATAVLLVKLGTKQWNLLAGVVAGLVFVGIPRSLWIATQARSYAMAAFAITLAISAFVLAIEKGKAGRWALFSVAMIAAIWTFLYNILLLPVLIAVAVVQRPASVQWRRAWLSFIAVVVASLPLFLAAASQRGQIGWINRTTLKRAVTAPYYAFFDGTNTVVAVAGWVALLAVCAAMLTWSTLRLPQGAHQGTALSPTAALVLLLGWAMFPGAALLTAGAFMSLYYDTYLVISVPALALLVGGGVATLGSRKWQAGIVVVLVAILAVQPWMFFRAPNSKSDMLDAVAMVKSHARIGDAVLFVEGGDWNTRQLKYAYPDSFRGLRDLSIDQEFETSGAFFGSSKSLEDLRAELDGVDRVIMLANSTGRPKSEFASNLATLDSAGLRTVADESTGKWRLVVLER